VLSEPIYSSPFRIVHKSTVWRHKKRMVLPTPRSDIEEIVVQPRHRRGLTRPFDNALSLSPRDITPPHDARLWDLSGHNKDELKAKHRRGPVRPFSDSSTLHTLDLFPTSKMHDESRWGLMHDESRWGLSSYKEESDASSRVTPERADSGSEHELPKHLVRRESEMLEGLAVHLLCSLQSSSVQPSRNSAPLSFV